MAELGSPQPPTIPASADPLIDTTDTLPPARPGPETVSRFLLITIGEGAQSGPLNPFQLHRAVSRFGEASRVAKRSDGKVEVEMATPEGAQRLLSSRALCFQTKRGTETVPVTVCAHPTKGLAVGVITAPELKDVEEEEIQEELRDQGIQKVRRLQRRDGDVSVPSDSLVLTFSQEKPPIEKSVSPGETLLCGRMLRIPCAASDAKRTGTSRAGAEAKRDAPGARRWATVQRHARPPQSAPAGVTTRCGRGTVPSCRRRRGGPGRG